MRPCLAAVCLAAISCASAPPSGPFFGDERFLRFGVDPQQEAAASIEDQRQQGRVVALRLNGEHFSAIGYMDPSGCSAAVRIVTLRGIAVALDTKPATALGAEVRYTLLAPPIEGTHDADHDGFEEVFVEQRAAAGTCVELYRVRDVGYVDPVQREARAFGKDLCPSAALDLNGDGKVELLAEIELDGFESVRPRLRLVLWANAHRFELRGQPEAAAAHARAERAEREAALAEAQRGRDVREAMRLGIELAALAQLDGADARGQVAQLDQALRGMVLEPAQAAALLGARERIFRDFGAASPAAPAAGTPAAADVQEEQDRLGRAPGLQKSQG